MCLREKILDFLTRFNKPILCIAIVQHFILLIGVSTTEYFSLADIGHKVCSSFFRNPSGPKILINIFSAANQVRSKHCIAIQHFTLIIPPELRTVCQTSGAVHTAQISRLNKIK